MADSVTREETIRDSGLDERVPRMVHCRSFLDGVALCGFRRAFDPGPVEFGAVDCVVCADLWHVLSPDDRDRLARRWGWRG